MEVRNDRNKLGKSLDIFKCPASGKPGAYRLIMLHRVPMMCVYLTLVFESPF